MTQLVHPEAQPGPGAALSADQRLELERLRREVAGLRTERDRRPRREIRWCSFVAAVLIVLGCALMPVAVVAVWTHNQVSDTDRFVRSVSPLVADPDVQNRLIDRVTATIFEYVDVQGLADEGIHALEVQGLPPELGGRLQNLTPTLASAATGFVRDRVADVVASPAFASAWDKAIATAHRQLTSVLSGQDTSVVIRGDRVYLDLAPFIDLAGRSRASRTLSWRFSAPMHPRPDGHRAAAPPALPAVPGRPRPPAHATWRRRVRPRQRSHRAARR